MLDDFKRMLTFNIAITAVAVLIFISLIFWLASDINKRTEAVQGTKKEIALRFQAVEALASLKKNAEDAKVQKVSLNVRLPVQDKLIDFPKDITALAKKNNIELGFSFNREKAGNEIEPGFISFAMTTQGSLDNWLNFIKDIEKSHYLVSFDSFNLAGDGRNFKSIINGKIFSQ